MELAAVDYTVRKVKTSNGNARLLLLASLAREWTLAQLQLTIRAVTTGRTRSFMAILNMLPRLKDILLISWHQLPIGEILNKLTRLQKMILPQALEHHMSMTNRGRRERLLSCNQMCWPIRMMNSEKEERPSSILKERQERLSRLPMPIGALRLATRSLSMPVQLTHTKWDKINLNPAYWSKPTMTAMLQCRRNRQ